jgi:hemolysin activation/secretion protein
VRELRIAGNTLITTEELLAEMPLIFNASDKPLAEAESAFLYDFRVLHDIVLDPGRTRQVSARTIQGLTQYILSVYSDKNYAGIYVYVPSEAVREGVELRDDILPVNVLEATVTDVTITTYDPNQNETEEAYLRPSAVMEWSPVKVGQVANQKELDDFVNLLNLNPDRYVSAVVTKGREPESLAVAYDIYEANPWHYFVQVDNSGTNDRKWNPRVGLINTNLSGIDDRFTAMVQGPVESDLDDNYFFFGNYDFPLLGPRLRLNVYGGRSTYDIGSEGGGIDFRGNGEFYGSGLRFNAFQKEGWFFDLLASLSHEKSKLTPSLFSSVLKYNLDMDLLGVGVDVHRSDDMSDTSLLFNRIESIGGDSRTEFTKARSGTSPDFRMYIASAAHSQYLDPNEVQRLRGSVRWIDSSGRLAPSKMTTFGGLYTVRGYKEDQVVADGGMLISGQYEFDLVKYDESKGIGGPEAEKPEKKPALRKLAPLVFFDFGRAKIKSPVLGERDTTELCSVGAGALFEIGDNFSGGVYYGYPLRGAGNTDTGEGRLNVSLLLRW